ncbi:MULTISPECIES: sulfotransferase [unclassified Streptomyces]|uniref:sulfotransferase n=1 Tax=unclassified Streptomyces TaxID=2593676 RepID=UPI0036E9F0D5
MYRIGRQLKPRLISARLRSGAPQEGFRLISPLSFGSSAGRCPMIDQLLDRVSDLLVIVCSPRGGSSLLSERLRSRPELLHLPGETPPLLTLAGLDPLVVSGDDTLTEEHAARFASPLERELACEVGNPAAEVHVAALERWLGRRLRLQWPDETFNEAEIHRCVEVARQRQPLPRDAAAFSALEAFHLEFLAAVRTGHPAVDPYYYDIGEAAVAARFPDVPVPSGPSGERLVEVPPFLVARPWRAPRPDEIAGRTLVIKAPSCCYQLPFWKALFPRARVRVLHLTRAPGPAVNGLMAAWRHRGFFSRRVDVDLDITGYTDTHPGWARRWWNFDLPPGWRGMTDEPLARVCGFQWASAHRASLAASATDDVLTVRHEDLIGAPPTSQAAMRRIGDWLGLPGQAIDDLSRLTVGPVSAVTTPDENRWMRHRALIDPFLDEAPVREIARELGYLQAVKSGTP